MRPRQFVWVQLRRVGRKEKQLDPIAVVFDEGPHEPCLVDRMSVDDQEDLAIDTGDQAREEVGEDRAVTRPSTVMNRRPPCALTAESLFSEKRAPVA